MVWCVPPYRDVGIICSMIHARNDSSKSFSEMLPSFSKSVPMLGILMQTSTGGTVYLLIQNRHDFSGSEKLLLKLLSLSYAL